MMLDVLPLCNLLLFNRNSFFPNSRSIQYLVPQHQQTGLFHKILLFFFFPTFPSTSSIFFFSCFNTHDFIYILPYLLHYPQSEECAEGSACKCCSSPNSMVVCFQEERAQESSLPAGLTSCGWQSVGGCPLSTLLYSSVLVGAASSFAKLGFFEKKLREWWNGNHLWGITELSECPRVSTVQCRSDAGKENKIQIYWIYLVARWHFPCSPTLFLFLGFLTERKEYGKASIASFSNSPFSSIALLLTGTSCLLATLKWMYINKRVTEITIY